MNDFLTCPHCGEISHIGGLVGKTTDDCPKCGKPVLQKTLLVWQPLWDAMDANPDKWIPTTKNMYWEMLEVLPPEIISQTAFLVGEASNHNKDGKAVYSCFKQVNDDYFAKNLTVSEFKNQFVPLKGWVSV